jgi:hypothetical protein
MKADAERNVRLGWCPCGSEYAHECECHGLYRLAVSQGLKEPEIERHTQPDYGPVFDQELSTYGTSVNLRRDQ